MTEQEECCICFYPIDSQKDIGLLECGHTFHMECIYDWFSQKNSNYKCPICFIQRDIIEIIPKGSVKKESKIETKTEQKSKKKRRRLKKSGKKNSWFKF